MIRRLEVLIVTTVLVVAAFSTGLPFLFYLLYLAILVIGGSYVLVRLGLTDLEAGYAVSQLHGHVGDRLRVTYTLRNGSRFPKLWLEVHNPTTLPGALPGRAITLPGRSERSWLIRVPLTRRGHFRIEPLHIRTGDPFGFFEAAATVGQGVSVVIYPRLEPIPAWRLPSAILEGSHASPVRTLQTTPLATSVRPYAPGDSMNRIHWKTTARHGEIQVKEFDLEQTADAWIVLDLQRGIGGGQGDESTVEAADPRRRRHLGQGDRREPGRRDDHQRRSHGVPAGGPRRPPAPEDHAVARSRRGGRQRAARRDPDRHRQPPAPRDDRRRRSPRRSTRPGSARSRACGAVASRASRSRSTSGRTTGPPATARPRSRATGRRSIPRPRRPPPSAPAPSATPSRSTSCRPT